VPAVGLEPLVALQAQKLFIPRFDPVWSKNSSSPLFHARTSLRRRDKSGSGSDRAHP